MKQYKDTPYYVTEDGKVFRDEKQIFGWITKKGYQQIKLYCFGIKKHAYIHRMVGDLFVPNPENKPQINHKNGNKLDNRVENLEWVTNQENINHSVENGLRPVGIDVPAHKLSVEDILWIRKNFVKGDSNLGCMGLGKKFGVNASCISKIVNNKMWKHI